MSYASQRLCSINFRLQIDQVYAQVETPARSTQSELEGCKVFPGFDLSLQQGFPLV